MEASWIAWAGFGLGVVNLGMQVVKMRREKAASEANDRRHAATEARLRSHDGALLLIEIRQRLQQLHDAALVHLAPGGGTDETGSALTTHIDDAAFWAERSRSPDVRSESLVFIRAATVARNVGPSDSEAHKEKARQAIRDTMRAASKAVGAALDELGA